MVKKVITNLDSSKASDLDCIPVVFVRNYEPKLSYMLAELLNKFQKHPCFPESWKLSSLVPVFKMLGKGL